MDQPGLAKNTNLTLELLEKFPWLKQFYLAGGTALAIQLKHRLSFDLDFFTDNMFDQQKLHSDLLQFKDYKLDRFAANTLLGILSETKISFFTYKYPLISPAVPFRTVKLAGTADLAAMKLDAIGSRGTKRDFVDLYFICQRLPLEKCFESYKQKYSKEGNNLFHLLKSLTYFADAENPPQQLKMLKPTSWKTVKKFFEKEAVRLGKKYLEN